MHFGRPNGDRSMTFEQRVARDAERLHEARQKAAQRLAAKTPGLDHETVVTRPKAKPQQAPRTCSSFGHEDRPAKARGLCSMCHRAWLRARDKAAREETP